MWQRDLSTSQAETVLAIAIVVLIILAVLLPPHAQEQAYHAFADQRAWAAAWPMTSLVLPNALDTLTNGAFMVVGALGLYWLKSGSFHAQSINMRLSIRLFALGAIAIGLTSTYYHLDPTDSSLVPDRMAMAFTFAAVLAMMAQDRVSSRAGACTLLTILVLGPCSVLIWAMTGNLAPYYVLQFGGLLLLIVMLLLRGSSGNGPGFVALLVCYTLAKISEALDLQIYTATHELISGHSLKHLFAALGMLLLLWPMRTKRQALGKI